MRPKILSIGLALIPAVLVCAHSSLGEAKGDECRAKPDSSAPARLHWYYRVDRANDRHCWYLHERGMRVHSLINAPSHSSESENDTAGEPVWKTPPVPAQPEYEQTVMTAEQPAADFAARWVDLPKSADAHEFVAERNGYAQQKADNRQEQLPPALANVSATDSDAPQDADTQTNFGSISLAGAVILALLLISEALVRFARRSAWSLLRFNLRTKSLRRTDHSELALNDAEQHGPVGQDQTEFEPTSRTQTGVNELRDLLQRADSGLRPAQSFAPSRSVHRAACTQSGASSSAQPAANVPTLADALQ
jgi:hypothetical protein